MCIDLSNLSLTDDARHGDVKVASKTKRVAEKSTSENGLGMGVQIETKHLAAVDIEKHGH